ncbi:MAG: hypothetical protein U1C60_09360 [Rhodocyclaceae bacterium]|nr:hypothetical protein [Rhodocyclaceae bacterium]
MPARLEARLNALEQAVPTDTDRVTIIRFVDVGELDKPMTKIEHGGRVWHILPDETEAAFIARVRSETTVPRAIFLTS